MKSPIESLRSLSRTLMLPIAILPAAALLLRLGQPDLLNIHFMEAAGSAVFANLGLIFAVGVAIGFAKDNNGAAGLGAVVCFVVVNHGAEALITVPAIMLAGVPPASIDLVAAAYKTAALAKLAVPIGILSGAIGGTLYNRYSNLKLPEFLGFFAGVRFVPIVGAAAGLLVAAVIGMGYDTINGAVDTASRAVLNSGDIGLFIYGFLNKVLLVTGLHHVVNNIAWFVIGDYHGTSGDLRRFFAGDPTAGAFMAGYFPIMMFGLPAACLAMYHAASPERRPAVAGMLVSFALTTFITGITEPVEFTFMFLSPVLFLLHAALTGLSMVLMNLLNSKLGFGFSAGLFDYVLNFRKATRPLMLLPVGAAYFGVYYGMFRFFIACLDLKTPGREANAVVAATSTPMGGGRGEQFIAALGGASNLVSIDACLTRLRLTVSDQGAVNESALKSLGARGLVRPSEKALQVVLGSVADQVAREIRTILKVSEPPHNPTSAVADETSPANASSWCDLAFAVGGLDNIVSTSIVSGRLRLEVRHGDAVDEAALERMHARGLVRVGLHVVHVLLGPDNRAAAAALGTQWSTRSASA